MTIADTIYRVWRDHPSVQSDFARTHAATIAAAASSGLITTHLGQGEFGRIWRPTRTGLDYMEHNQDGIRY